MDSAMFSGRKPLLPEIPIMKFSRPFVHQKSALRCIAVVHKLARFTSGAAVRGSSLQMHRIGDRIKGARV